jgi:hypothetical protein
MGTTSMVYSPFLTSTQKDSEAQTLHPATRASLGAAALRERAKPESLKLPLELVHRDGGNDNAAVHHVLPESVDAQDV